MNSPRVTSSSARPPRAAALFSGAVLACGLLAPVSASAQPALTGGNCVMPPRPPGPAERDARPRRAPRVFPPLPPEFAPHREAALGSAAIPVILVDFPDEPATRTPSDIYDKFFALDAISVRDYYRETSYGQYDPTGQVIGWFRSSLDHNYFANAANPHGLDSSPAARTEPYDHNVWGLLEEMVDLADPTVDFSDFDSDGDGVVDVLILVHQGKGGEEVPIRDDFIWSHKFDLRQALEPGDYPFAPGGLATADGVVIGPYIVVPEIGEIGVICHEYGHVLGLPDLYVTSGDLPSPIGFFCIMDAGAWTLHPDSVALRQGSLPVHFCGWSKYALGWIDPPGISASDQTLALQDVQLPPMSAGTASDPGVLRLLENVGGMDWTTAGTGRGRYFLVENRQAIGFDAGLFSPAALEPRREEGGLLITFVDERRRGNAVDPAASLLYVVQADGESTVDGALPTLGEQSDLWPRLGVSPDRFDATTAASHGIFTSELQAVQMENIVVAPGADATFDASLPADTPVLAYPNPARGVDNVTFRFLPSPGSARRVRILSLSGELVRVLQDAPEVDPDEGAAFWDLRDQNGARVSSGAFIYHVEGAGESARGVVTVIR